MRIDDFLDAFYKGDVPKLLRYATIADGYVGGKPNLVFDGESIPSGKRYAKLASYTPQSGDRVAVLGDLVLGAIG
ncbi:hypothetical protein [Sporosarcina sp. ITBMC105]